MKPLPQYILNHQAAQDAGQFSPYYQTTTQPMKHLNQIVTNARQGLPTSTTNRPRRRVNLPALALLAALAAFWIVAGFLVTLAR